MMKTHQHQQSEIKVPITHPLKATAIGVSLIVSMVLVSSSAISKGDDHHHADECKDSSRDNSPILPPQARVARRNLSEWVEAFSKWTLPIPTSLSFFDDGRSFSLNQSGPVWFLQPGCNDRSCILPEGKFLFAPLTFAWNEFPCPDPTFKPAPGQSMEDFLKAGLAPFFDGKPPVDGALVVDGKPLTNLGAYRATSKLFNSVIDYSYNTSLGDPCAGFPTIGSPQPCVMDGYWVIIKPLSVGQHTLEYPGCDVIHLTRPGGGSPRV